ncbi:MAG: Cof-type HAD-IIB family hydrolase [Spirochaetaceae bacterium]|jgi:Cof subfamily protein (haloacid dehalogenase superfamily)|nr:Cof-type HAD-IIB family hydrolase [Spirochaetaceae bacterium]GMO18927.1 MAG: Cof-type HAD-IIB family hydrolase [Termitinemataceae bacterium]
MMFKLIALDLDDTLLRTDLTISPKTKNALKKAISRGVIVVFATGRVPNALRNYVKLLGLHKSEGYLICGNGTQIINSRSGALVDEARLPSKAALAAFDLADAEDFCVQIYDGNNIIVSRRNEFSDADEKLTGMKQLIPENFRELLVERGAYKLVIPADPMLLRPLEEILRNVLSEEVTLFTSKPYYLEILPPACDKGAALAKVAAKLGVKQNEVMAFGDSMNDEAMIRWAGCGVAMCNGDDRIKSSARLVTEKSNDEDGIALVIERYVLGQEALPQ